MIQDIEEKISNNARRLIVDLEKEIQAGLEEVLTEQLTNIQAKSELLSEYQKFIEYKRF